MRQDGFEVKDILLGNFCILCVALQVWVAISLGINKEGKGKRKMCRGIDIVKGGLWEEGEAKLEGNIRISRKFKLLLYRSRRSVRLCRLEATLTQLPRCRSSSELRGSGEVGADPQWGR